MIDRLLEVLAEIDRRFPPRALSYCQPQSIFAGQCIRWPGAKTIWLNRLVALTGEVKRTILFGVPGICVLCRRRSLSARSRINNLALSHSTPSSIPLRQRISHAAQQGASHTFSYQSLDWRHCTGGIPGYPNKNAGISDCNHQTKPNLASLSFITLVL